MQVEELEKKQRDMQERQAQQEKRADECHQDDRAPVDDPREIERQDYEPKLDERKQSQESEEVIDNFIGLVGGAIKQIVSQYPGVHPDELADCTTRVIESTISENVQSLSSEQRKKAL